MGVIEPAWAIKGLKFFGTALSKVVFFSLKKHASSIIYLLAKWISRKWGMFFSCKKQLAFWNKERLRKKAASWKKGHPINFAHFHICAQSGKTRNSLSPKKYLITSLVKPLLARNFWPLSVKVNFCKFYTVFCFHPKTCDIILSHYIEQFQLKLCKICRLRKVYLTEKFEHVGAGAR